MQHSEHVQDHVMLVDTDVLHSLSNRKNQIPALTSADWMVLVAITQVSPPLFPRCLSRLLIGWSLQQTQNDFHYSQLDCEGVLRLLQGTTKQQSAQTTREARKENWLHDHHEDQPGHISPNWLLMLFLCELGLLEFFRCRCFYSPCAVMHIYTRDKSEKKSARLQQMSVRTIFTILQNDSRHSIWTTLHKLASL